MCSRAIWFTLCLPSTETRLLPDSCIEEWPELKLRVREILTKEPTMKYLPMWRRILNEYKENPALTNVLALLQIVLVIPVQIATLERGFLLMKRTKSDWQNRLSPKTLTIDNDQTQWP